MAYIVLTPELIEDLPEVFDVITDFGLTLENQRKNENENWKFDVKELDFDGEVILCFERTNEKETVRIVDYILK